MIGSILVIIGIVLLIEELKHYGYLMINGEDWKFHFNKREDIASIEYLIKEVYFIKSE